MHSALFLASLLPFYLLGCFPSGVIVARRYGIEIEKAGSGNVGATNVTRVIGIKAGALTCALDIAKGVLAVIIAALLNSDVIFKSASAVAVIAGHCFSIPGRLKGGKGVATSLGAFLWLSPLSALFGLIVFAVVFTLKRIVSLASVMAVLLTAVFGMLTGESDAICFALMISALLVSFRHRENLTRLAEGREKIFEFK